MRTHPRAAACGSSLILALVAGSLMGGPLATAASTDARSAAKPRYVKLKTVGLQVRTASLKSRTLRVKVTATRRLALRFAIVRGSKQLGSAKIRVPRGTTSLKLLLNRKSTGKNLKLRVTARSARRTGRQKVGVELLPLPLRGTPNRPPDTGAQGPPTAPPQRPPTANTPTPPAPTPPQAPPNNQPSDLQLTNASVAENLPAGSTVGNLVGTDPDPGDTLSYSFATGPGDADNGSFTLSSGTLRTAAPFDFETKSSYSVRLAVSDGVGGVFERAFTIAVTNANEAPTAIVASSTTVAENLPGGSAVGTLSATDPDAGDTATFALVPGTGADDNASFAIVGGELQTVAPFDFETKSSYTVRVRATDAGGEFFEQAIPISVSDANDPPTDITLSNASVAENRPAGEPVGTLVATDEDVGATASFSLVPGTGGDDNASFSIVGGELRTATVLDFETTSALSVRVRAEDGAGGSVEKAFAITVSDVNDPPVLTTSATPLAYAEGDPATPVDPALTVADQDDANLTGATVSISAGLRTADELVFTDQNGITGSYDTGTGVLTLTGASSVANYGTALRSVAFRHTGSDPGTSRTVSFVVNDGDDPSAAATRDITITAAPDGPVIATTASPLAYTENDGAVAVDPGLTLTDPDSTLIGGASVRIATSFTSAQDELGFTDTAEITGSYDDFTGILTLTGTATVAAYEIALRSVTYTNSSESPSPSTRTITFGATDDGGTASNIASRDVAITAVNDAPTAVADSGTTDEDTPLAVAAPGVLGNDTDPDTGDTKTVTRLNGSTTLTGTSTKGATVTIAADGAYSYDPDAVFQGLSTGESDTDSFTYTMADGGGETSTATVSLTITGVSDAPTAQDKSVPVVGNTSLFVGTTRPAAEAGRTVTASLLDGATDPDSAPGELVVEAVTDAATTLGGSITIAADGTFTYRPDAGDTGTDTFTYRICDASPCSASTVANDTATISFPINGEVWYVRNSDGSGGDGTADAPFDTLLEAEGASGTGDTTYVFRGDGTSTNLSTGFLLDPQGALVGERTGLTLDPDDGGPLGAEVLHPASASARPVLTTTDAEDAVVLQSGTRVTGVEIAPGDAGGGIGGGPGAGGPAVAGATIDDVVITDGSASGTQPGLELSGTTGATAVSDLAVTMSGPAAGIRLSNAGTVTFASASAITSTTAGGPALDAANTALGTSAFDALTTSASSTGGVSLVSTTGAVTLGDGSGDDVVLTTSGATPALRLTTTGAVTLAAAGTDTISATGGPAVAVSGAPGSTLELDSASSSASTGDGIDLAGLGSGTFSAPAGTIAGAAGIAVDVDGGSGDVAYGGALGVGAGSVADVTNRTGGAVTISGAITDSSNSGGGITLSGNTGGSTTFSGTTKQILTSTQDAVVMAASDGHTLSLTGGGLDIDATSGRGLEASASGTLVVTGTGNTIDTTTGRALRIAGTDIGAAGATFERISSNGAPNGIVLDGTGTSAGLTVTGAGGTCTAASPGCTGGVIRNAPGGDDSGTAPTGTGIVLRSTRAPSLTRVHVHDHANYAIRGHDVTGFTLTDSVVGGTNGTTAASPFNDGSVRFTNLTGSAAVTRTAISGGHSDNLAVVNSSGSLDRLTLDTVAIGANSTTGGNDGVLLESTSSAGALKATVQSSTFTSARADLLQFSHAGTGAGDLVVTGSAFSNAHPAIATGGGGLSLFDDGGGGDTTMSITGNAFRDAVGHAVLAVKTPGTSSLSGTFSTNQIGVSGVADSGSLEGSGLRLQNAGQGTATWSVTGNTIRGYNNHGVDVLAGGGAVASAGALNTTITGNTITDPGSSAGTAGLSKHGVSLNIGTVPGDTYQACAVITGNALTTSGVNNGDIDVRLRQRQSTTIRLPGYGGSAADTTAVQTYVDGNNGGGNTVLASVNSPPGGGFTGTGTTCP